MSSSFINILQEARMKSSCRLKKSSIFVFLTFVICSIDLSVHRLIVEAGESTAVIYTSTGPVRGEILSSIVKSVRYSSFRSIRYGEPTSGYNRFKPPVPAKPWTDVLNATVEANACPQVNLITLNYTGTEDCLFVNVFTPVTDFNKKIEKGKAVMVWIYGGSFISGNAKTILYGADFLIEDDVILVTFNYRLGPLGFLSLNHPNATGNAGMKDQVLALKWINENIGKFGGDTEKITIFGNSAGAVSVDLLTLSDLSHGLFHGVISISGSVFNPWAFHKSDEAVNQGFALGSTLGTNTTDKELLLGKLYEATTYEIVQAALNTSEESSIQTPFRPTVEDPKVAGNHAFMTESPLSKYKTGNFTKVPYVTGFNAQETVCMVTEDRIKDTTKLVNTLMATLDELNYSLPLITPTLENLISTAENSIKQISHVTLQELVQLSSFEHLSAGIDVKQRFLNAQSSKPVYYYQLSFNPSKTLHELLYHESCNGSAHADELAYIFYMPIVDLPLDESDPISITRRRVVRLWTNFAKYGNPTPEGKIDPIVNVTWPASGSSGLHLEIGDELTVGPRPVDALNKYLQLLEQLN